MPNADEMLNEVVGQIPQEEWHTDHHLLDVWPQPSVAEKAVVGRVPLQWYIDYPDKATQLMFDDYGLIPYGYLSGQFYFVTQNMAGSLPAASVN